MGLNKAVFRVRASTALLFVMVMLGGLFIHAYSFIGLFCIILIGCLYEFVKLLKLINPTAYLTYIVMALPYIVMPICMMLHMGLYENSNTNRVSLYSPIVPCTIVFSIWINDTMAYLVGSFMGKTAFSKISPKKTWEGTIGGGLLCVTIVAGIAYLLNAAGWLAQAYTIHASVIALLCAIFGTIGDLLESKIKRLANVKDSGSFMPGHGGFLDRFDSMLVAIPFVWLYWQVAML